MKKPIDAAENSPIRRIRVEDVARLAGVSPITVSRTLSHPEKVRLETRERVEAAVAQTGYMVNTIASNLRSGRSSIISMFVSTLENAELNKAIQGVSDTVNGSGFHLMMGKTASSPAAQAEAIAATAQMNPAGVILAGFTPSPAIHAALRSVGCPVVELGDDHDVPFDMMVSCSNKGGGKMMAAHFADQGFEHIAYMGSRLGRVGRRLEGFSEELGRRGVKLGHVQPIEGPTTPADGRAGFDAIMENFARCEAIFLADPMLAIGAALRAELAGLSEAVALGAFGEVGLAQILPMPLTTVTLSSYESGVSVARLMLRRLRGDKLAAQAVQCAMRLDMRASTERRRVAAE